MVEDQEGGGEGGLTFHFLSGNCGVAAGVVEVVAEDGGGADAEVGWEAVLGGARTRHVCGGHGGIGVGFGFKMG